LHRVSCELSALRLAPVRVELPRPVPTQPERYHRLFNAQVTFEAERCVLVYFEAELRAPLTASDARLTAILACQAQSLIAELPVISGLIEQVRADIRAQLVHGEVTIGVTAAHLGMSERTLRRHLHQAGRSYRSLRDDVRREHALRLAREQKLNVTAIAHLLGFGDATAFARAFKRWTGMAPREYGKKWHQPASGRKSRLL
jgi:AraC-like DNA-binding protein